MKRTSHYYSYRFLPHELRLQFLHRWLKFQKTAQHPGKSSAQNYLRHLAATYTVIAFIFHLVSRFNRNSITLFIILFLGWVADQMPGSPRTWQKSWPISFLAIRCHLSSLSPLKA